MGFLRSPGLIFAAASDVISDFLLSLRILKVSARRLWDQVPSFVQSSQLPHEGSIRYYFNMRGKRDDPGRNPTSKC